MTGAEHLEYGAHGRVRSAPLRVLVVDASAPRRAALAEGLAGQGLRVAVADSGAQGLAMLHGEPLDAVLLDAELPQPSAALTIERVKSDEALRDRAVIVLGAAGDAPARQQALRAGAEDYLPRDVDPAELALRLHNLSSLRATYRELRGRNDALSQQLEDESRRATYFEQFSRNSLDACPGAVVVVDGRGCIVATNQAWQDAMQDLGQGPGQAGMGSAYRASWLFSDPAEAQRLQDCLERVLHGDAQQSVHEYRTEVATPPRWFRARFSRFLEGRALLVMISHEDVTDQRMTKGALDATAEQLREVQAQVMHGQRLEAVGRLVGGVSHDFNNLLTSIICFTRFVIDDMPEDDPRRPDLLEVLRAADNAARLTNQLLMFSQRRPARPAVLDLNAALLGVGRVLRRVLGSGIELVVLPSDEPSHVLCDAGQFDQLLFSLALHAKEALMPRGGTITIALGQVKHAAAEHIELRVAGTREGLTTTVGGHASAAFPHTRTERRGGGLDLVTCADIARQAGGELAHDDAGQGHSFRVLLPRASDPRKLEGPRTSTEAQPGLHGTALVVEDQPTILSTMARALESAGLTVLQASSGEDAMAVLRGREGVPELIVTDMMLPGMSGVHLVEHLRSRSPDVRVVFVSGYGAEDMPSTVGVDDRTAFVAKPFTGRQLVSRAASLFSRVH